MATSARGEKKELGMKIARAIGIEVLWCFGVLAGTGIGIGNAEFSGTLRFFYKNNFKI